MHADLTKRGQDGAPEGHSFLVNAPDRQAAVSKARKAMVATGYTPGTDIYSDCLEPDVWEVVLTHRPLAPHENMTADGQRYGGVSGKGMPAHREVGQR